MNVRARKQPNSVPSAGLFHQLDGLCAVVALITTAYLASSLKGSFSYDGFNIVQELSGSSVTANPLTNPDPDDVFAMYLSGFYREGHVAIGLV